MSKLLFDEQPVIASRELAKLIGLNEAIVLQQIHYWIDINKKAKKNFRDGRYWTYNSLKNWHENDFPFWSFKTVQRTITALVNKGFLILGNYNKLKLDQTKWYTIDYEVLETLILPIWSKCPNADGQNGQMEMVNLATWSRSKCPNADGQFDHTNTKELPKTYSKTTTTTKPENNVVVVSKSVDEILKTTKKEPDVAPATSDSIKQLMFDNLNITLTQKQVAIFNKLCNGNVDKIIEKIQIMKKQTEVEKPIGWLIVALQEDYKENAPYIDNEKNKSSNKFANYEQREWDYDEIERLAMEIT